MKNLIYKAENTHALTLGELTTLLEASEYDADIFAAADRVRKKYVGDAVHLRGLIEFSNICRCFCMYCGLRCENKNADRYRLTEDEIVETARKAAETGYETVVLQSGEDVWFSAERMSAVIRRIKAFDVAVTLSIGERPFEDYKAFKDAGADRYLLRIETSDKTLYEAVHPNMSFENRLRCLKDLKTLGYEVGTGCLVGLPNQTSRHLAQDILFFQKIEADMIGIGPYIPHPQTPLKNAEGGDFITALKVMALTRLLLPDINIPATTAMEALAPNGQAAALNAGANVIMPNATNPSVRQKYEIYPGKTPENPAEDARKEVTEKILSLGRIVGTGRGGHTSLPYFSEN